MIGEVVLCARVDPQPSTSTSRPLRTHCTFVVQPPTDLFVLRVAVIGAVHRRTHGRNRPNPLRDMMRMQSAAVVEAAAAAAAVEGRATVSSLPFAVGL